MLGTTRMMNGELTPYATKADFCRIFEDNMNRLYWLSFLLTANHTLAEKCFVRGLDDSRDGNPVFKEWAQAWARRTIIQNAIQLLRPRPADNQIPNATPESASLAAALPVQMAGIIELPVFERFVFVMSVLEGCSDQECSVLLACTRREVVLARLHALQRLGRSADVQPEPADIDLAEQKQREDPGSRLLTGTFPRLAASA